MSAHAATKTYEGKACPRCGGAARYESTGGCVCCTQTSAREAYRRNPDAHRASGRASYHNHKDRHRDTVLRSTYGISLEQYRQMQEQQGGLCAICRGNCRTGRNLSVDHNHSTRQVRGLLCLNCNRAVGNLNDDPSLLRAAAAYLEKK